MAKRTCSIADCGKPVRSAGYCWNHYYRFNRYGDPFGKPAHIPPIERFMAKVEKVADGCWNWTASLRRGYPVFKADGKQYGHTWAYEYFIGPIPEGFQVHHVCRNKRCVNPDHLELRDKSSHMRLHNPRWTHCKRGHLMDDANTQVYVAANGWVYRRCRTCFNMRSRLYNRGKKVSDAT